MSSSSSSSSHRLPTLVLMQWYGHKLSFFNYGGAKGKIPHAVTRDTEKGVFNPLAKMEVEQAKINSSYVHLKFPETKKYLAALDPQREGTWVVVANSDKPEEDTMKPSCTLFKPVRVSNNGETYHNLIHVHSGFQVQIDTTQKPRGLSASRAVSPDNKFIFVDWDTIVKLPEHVAFKGDNGKYLQTHQQNDLPYLQFSSDDPYDSGSVFHIEQRLDGFVRIKSEYYQKFWRYGSSWIWADEDRQGSLNRLDDVFWPTKINESTIALRSAANNKYCARRYDVDGKKNCLNAAVETIEKPARLEVEELVSERTISMVMYHLEEARIIDEKPHSAGRVTVENKGDREAAVAVDIAYEDEKAINFSHGFSATAGVTATLSASVPFIVDGTLQLHTEVTKSFEWGHTTTEKQMLKATGTVTVPARHMAVVHCVGTKGTCNIPFSYMQLDRSSVDETITRKTYHDGVFSGSNSYNFDFIIDEAIPIK